MLDASLVASVLTSTGTVIEPLTYLMVQLLKRWGMKSLGIACCFPVQLHEKLKRATYLRIPLKPLFAIPRVMGCLFLIIQLELKQLIYLSKYFFKIIQCLCRKTAFVCPNLIQFVCRPIMIKPVLTYCFIYLFYDCNNCCIKV